MNTKIIFSITAGLLISAAGLKAQATIGSNVLTGTPTAPDQFLGSSSTHDVVFKAAGTERMRIDRSTGNIGMGITLPQEKLDIGGAIRMNGFSIYLGADRYHGIGWYTSNFATTGPFLNKNIDGPVVFGYQGGALGSSQLVSGVNVRTIALRWTADGSVSIGGYLSNNPYKLAVNGMIGARSIKVETATVWADYVFNVDYKLRSLSELEVYVKLNKHLPNIPSASEVEKDGIDVAAMDAKLLEKIEELSLYIIEQNKRITELEKSMKK
jgi:hypothetical protein